MKKVFLAIATVFAVLLSGCSEKGGLKEEAGGFIKVSGEDLVSPDGSKYFIKGTNLGCWLNPEGYMFGFGSRASSPRQIDEMFKEMVGPDRTAEFWKSFKDNYITEKDIQFIASSGANTIRIPFNYRIFTDEDYMGLSKDQDGFERIDSVVAWCAKAGLHVILDMHDCPGGQTGDNIDDSYGYPWLFVSKESQDLFNSIWRRIADHYKNETTILGYELMNEPIAPYFDDLDSLNSLFIPVSKSATEAIREVDKNHIVLIGSPQWNTNFAPVTDLSFDDNLMLTCHRYGGVAGADGIRDYINFRDSVSLPMFMGEIGHNTMEWQTTYSSVLQENNIGYAYWPYKKRDIECMVAFSVPEFWDEVVTFADTDRSTFDAVRKARPDQEKAWKAMQDYLEAVKFGNCKPLEDYINSMKLK